MSSPQVNSDLPAEVTEKMTRVVMAALKEVLTTLEAATKTDPDFPHRLEASIEWISLHAQGSGSSASTSCSIRVNSILHLKEGEEWKPVPGYCESFALDLSKSGAENLDGDLRNQVLITLLRVYEANTLTFR